MTKTIILFLSSDKRQLIYRIATLYSLLCASFYLGPFSFFTFTFFPRRIGPTQGNTPLAPYSDPIVFVFEGERQQHRSTHSPARSINTMPGSRRQHNHHHPSDAWVTAPGANVFYRPRRGSECLRALQSPARVSFPAPLIGPRRTRPHAIHIVTYPPGYIPRELRPPKTTAANKKPAPLPKRKSWKNRVNQHVRTQSDLTPTTSLKRQRPKLFSSASGSGRQSARSTSPVEENNTLSQRSTFTFSQEPEQEQQQPNQTEEEDRERERQPPTPQEEESTSEFPVPVPGIQRQLSDWSDSTGAEHQRSTGNSPATGILTSSAGISTPTSAYDIIPPHHLYSLEQQDLPVSAATTQLIPLSHLHQSDDTYPPPPSSSHITNEDIMTARVSAPSVGAGTYRLPNNTRTSLMGGVRTGKSAVTSLVTEVPKPVASGSGVSCSILLAEPNIFLSGFDHDGHAHREGGNVGTALLRGKLQLVVSKNIKIKAVQLKLLGRARTEWPEGIPPLKQEFHEEEGLRTQVLTFFNAMNDGWETDYGNQCIYSLREGSADSSSTNLSITPSGRTTHPLSAASSARSNLTSRDLKRLSLQHSQSRSFGKGENPFSPATQAKGFKVFYPGTYEYSFELPIDHHQLETTKLQYGSVKWELHATVDRAGAFKPNLHGVKEVSIIRIPDSMSLEMVEPISISRQWEDQLHYDIVISGKSFPIGGKIPIAFKLTPLAKVQVHKLKVFVTESIEYWTNDKRVTRKDPGRKVLLLEKAAGKPLDAAWSSSELRTVRGGELSPDRREEARNMAARRRQYEASRTGSEPEPLPEATENLLGDIDLGLESIWGATEIEANVQLPTCEMMAKNKDKRLNPDCSWKNVNVYHWIKVRIPGSPLPTTTQLN